MGKITVKHYLNKRFKPTIIKNVECFPVYIQVIHNRINVQFKSFRIGKISENDFNYFLNELHNEMSSEKNIITAIIEYKKDINLNEIPKIFDFYGKPLLNLLISEIGFYISDKLSQKWIYKDLISILNYTDVNINNIFKIVEKYSKIQLEKFLNEKDVKLLNAIDIIENFMTFCSDNNDYFEKNCIIFWLNGQLFFEFDKYCVSKFIDNQNIKEIINNIVYKAEIQHFIFINEFS